MRQQWTLDWLVDRHAAGKRMRAMRARTTQRRGELLPHQSLALEYVRTTGRDCLLYWCRGSGKSSVMQPALVASVLLGDSEAVRGFHTVYVVTRADLSTFVTHAKRTCSQAGLRAVEKALEVEVGEKHKPALRVVDHARLCDVEYLGGCAIMLDDAHCLLDEDMVRPRDAGRISRCVRRARQAAVRDPGRYRAPLIVAMTDTPFGTTDEKRVLRTTQLLNLLAPDHPFFEVHPDKRHRQAEDMYAYYGIGCDSDDERRHRVDDPGRFHTRFGKNLAGMVLCHAPLRGMYLPSVRVSAVCVSSPVDTPPSAAHPDMYASIGATQRVIRRHHAVMPEDRLRAIRTCFPKAAELLDRLRRDGDDGGVCGVYAGSNPSVHEALRVGFELMGYDVLPAHRVAFGDASALRSDFDHRRVVLLHGEPDEVVERATWVINRLSLHESGSGASVRVLVLPGDYPRRCQTPLRNIARLDILSGDDGPLAHSADAVTRAVVCMHNIAPQLDVRVYLTTDTPWDSEWVDHTGDRPLTAALANATPRVTHTREHVRWHERATRTDVLCRLLHQTMCHFAVNCIVSDASKTCWMR